MNKGQQQEFLRVATQLPSLIRELTSALHQLKPKVAIIVINIAIRLLNDLRNKLKTVDNES